MGMFTKNNLFCQFIIITHCIHVNNITRERFTVRFMNIPKLLLSLTVIVGIVYGNDWIDLSNPVVPKRINGTHKKNVDANITDVSEKPAAKLNATQKIERKKISVSLDGFYIEQKTMSDGMYDVVEIPGWTAQVNEIGYPAVPIKNIIIPIAEGITNYDVSILHSDTSTVENISIGPAQAPEPDCYNCPKPKFSKNENVYHSTALYPASPLFRVSQITARNRRYLSIEITPIRTLPYRKEVVVTYSLDLQVTFTGNTSSIVPPGPSSGSFNTISPLPVVNLANEQPDVYMILCNDQFNSNSKLAEFVQWKKRKGYDVRVVPTSTINGNGAPDSSEIRRYLQGLSSSNYPLYLLIIGDQTAQSGVATHTFTTGQGGVTDLFYSFRDGFDILPDLYCGRLPALNNDELTTMLDKIIQMDRNPTFSSMYDKIMVAGQIQDADDHNNIADRIFCETADGIATYFEQVPGGRNYTVTRALVNPDGMTADARWKPAGILWSGEPIGPRVFNMFIGEYTATQLMNATVNNGCALVIHRDHGDVSGWVHPSYLTSQIAQLRNGRNLSLVYSVNCLTGSYHMPGSFLKPWLTNQGGGAYAVIAATDVSYSPLNDYLTHGMFIGVLGDYRHLHNVSINPDWSRDLPSTQGLFSEGTATKLGPMLYAGKAYMYANYGASLITFELFHLFGDPEAEVVLNTPQALGVLHTAFVDEGTTAISIVTGRDGVRVCLFDEGQQLSRIKIASNGKADFIVPALLKGRLQVTVTGFGVRPYLGTIEVISSGVAVSPDNIAFANVASGSSLEKLLSISNKSGSSITISGITSTNTAFTSTAAFPLVIPAGTVSSLPVRFTPAQAGSFESVVHLVASMNIGLHDVVVTGVGAGAATFSASPNPISCSMINGIKSMPLTISNTGGSDIVLDTRMEENSNGGWSTDFESGSLAGWTIPQSSTYITRGITTTTPAGGLNALMVKGYATVNYGLQYTFASDLLPDEFRFSFRANGAGFFTGRAGGLVLYSADGHEALNFYLDGDGQRSIINTGWGTGFAMNTWHSVRVVFNWKSSTYSFYCDGVYIREQCMRDWSSSLPPGVRTMTISNTNDAEIEFDNLSFATPVENKMSIASGNICLAPGQSAIRNVYFNASGLTIGTFTENIKIVDVSGNLATQVVPAVLTVADSNMPPTVSVAAAANPSPVTAKTTSLTVLGTDDMGESPLLYTWTASGTPPAAVTFSANGTNAAKNTVATFAKAGTYTLQATIIDAKNATATSSVNVTVTQTLTLISVLPVDASVAISKTLQYSANAFDQFGVVLSTLPVFTWSVSGGGTITSAGLFTAGTSAGSPYSVTAAAGGKSGTTSVTVTPTIALTRLQIVGVRASTIESASYAAGAAIDNSIATRWSSTFSDPQWIIFDMGAPKIITTVVFDWETANARNYVLEGSNDASFATKQTLKTLTNMRTQNHRIDSLNSFANQGSYRYYRMYGTARNTSYGYSIYDARLYSSGSPTTYTITASAGANGTMTPVGNVPVIAGANQTFTIAPNTGSVIYMVTVDGVSQGSLWSYTFNNVTGNHTIDVTFRQYINYIAVPGRIEAENYKPSGEGSGYHDLTAGNNGSAQIRYDDVDIDPCSEGGYYVGWTENGEWLAYDINVTQAGNYKMSARIASGVAGNKTLTITVDGNPLTTITTSVNNGWQGWTNVTSGNFILTAGPHLLRVTTSGGLNLNYYDIATSTSNLITNGDFSNGRTGWLTGGTTFGTLNITSEIADWSIINGSGQVWEPQMMQAISLVAGRQYTLCFDVRTTGSARSINVGVNGDADNNYVDRGLNQTVSVTYYSWVTQSFTFTANATDATSRLDFNLGGNANGVLIDNVRLVEGLTCN